MKKALTIFGGTVATLAIPLIASAQVDPNTGVGVFNQLQRLLTPLFLPDTNISPAALFVAILNLLILVAAIIAIVYLIWAGIRYITAGTDEEAAKKARAAIYNAIIGIVIIILSYTVIVWISRLTRNTVQQVGGQGSGFGGSSNNVVPGFGAGGNPFQ